MGNILRVLLHILWVSELIHLLAGDFLPHVMDKDL